MTAVYKNQLEVALAQVAAKLPEGFTIAPIKTDVTYSRTIVSVSPYSIPPRMVKKASLVFANLQLSSPGVLWVMLGRQAAIPLPYINPPASISGVYDIFNGESGCDTLQIDEFSLSQPIAGGSIVLVCVV